MFWSEINGFPFGTQGEPFFSMNSKLILGHRGSSFVYPENTILAFDKAIEEGGNGIELDVYLSSDGELIVIHDSTVNRTTSFTGAVSSYTAAELTAMDAGAWKGSEFADREDTKIPTLRQVLEYFENDDIFISIQLKVNAPLQVVTLVREYSMTEKCFLFANRSWIGAYKQQYPEFFVMNDGTGHTDSFGLLAQAVSENWDAISPGSNNITSGLVIAAHEANKLVQVSTINSNFATRTQDNIDMGVNIFLGDDVATMKAVFDTNELTQIRPSDRSDIND